jgi:hypothetical protein
MYPLYIPEELPTDTPMFLIESICGRRCLSSPAHKLAQRTQHRQEVPGDHIWDRFRSLLRAVQPQVPPILRFFLRIILLVNACNIFLHILLINVCNIQRMEMTHDLILTSREV